MAEKKEKGADHYDFDLDESDRRASEDVPWPRCGVPGYFGKERLHARKWGPHQLNKGADKHRLYSDEELVGFATHTSSVGRICLGMAEERCFAELWDYESNETHSRILHVLLNEGGIEIKEGREKYLVEIAAATVVQWLGTNCGSAFIDRARDNGRRLVEHLQPEVDRDLILQAAVGIESAEISVDRKRQKAERKKAQARGLERS